MTKTNLIIDKIQSFLFLILLFLIPLVFFPQVLSPFDTPKLLVIAFLLGLIVILGALKIIAAGAVSLTASNLNLPVFLFAGVYLLSALVKTPNKTEAFFQPGTATVFILGAIIFLAANSLFGQNKKNLVTALFLSGVIASLISLILQIGLLTKVGWVPTFLKATGFSVFGGKLPEAIFLAAVLPLGVGLFWQEAVVVKKVFWAVAAGVVALALALAVYRILPGKPNFPLLPDYATGWSVAVDTLKESPVLGIGPGNYLTAFTRFKPLAINLTNNWALNFGSAKSFWLTCLTETGLLGLAVLLFLFWRLYRTAQKNPVFVSLGILAASFLFFPGYLTSIFIFFVLLSAAATGKETVVNLKTANESALAARIPAIMLALVGLAAVGAVFFFGAKAALAEYAYTKAILAVNQNNAQTAYNALNRALKFNPRVDRYHGSLAQLDLAVASNLAQKKDLTDTDKNNLTQLIQEAIAAAKNAVSLNPQRAGNWQNLAGVYRAVMAFAQGADSFTIQAYTQAVALEPVNPDLRISLGGVYYALGRYDEAISSFQLATLAKADYANAHYNLAAAYREKGEIQRAVDELKVVLTLVKPDSADFTKVKDEVAELEKKLPPSAKATGGQAPSALTTPQPAEKPVIQPPLELPKEATPPSSP